MKASISLAMWPGASHEMAAASLLAKPTKEPIMGELDAAHVQLVPQSLGQLTGAVVDRLRYAWPSSRFRLHANVQVTPTRRIVDLSTFDRDAEWFSAAARISRRLVAPAYSAHPGRKAESSFEAVVDASRRCSDMFDCPVAIEGMYPANGDPWLISSWREYQRLFESPAHYALDLSHVNILVKLSGICEWNLLAEMLACERLLEVHVSENDGTRDSHQVCAHTPWWTTLLQGINEKAVIFSEGNHRTKGEAGW